MRIWFLLAAAEIVFAQPASRIWDSDALDRSTTPLAQAKFKVRHATADEYYRLPVVEVYRSYPVYRPDREPPNYIAFLQAQEPAIEWDASKLVSKGDWIRAGEMLFDAPSRLGHLASGISIDELKDVPFVDSREWFDAVKPPVGEDGSLPGFRYVIRKKGKVELGWFACSMCHARVMPDGMIQAGPPGEFTHDAALAAEIRHAGRSAPQLEYFRKRLRAMFFVPWAPKQELFEALGAFNNQQMAQLFDGHAGGSMSIDGAAPWARVKVPDLIGVATRGWLGATGSYRQTSSTDLARYIARHVSGVETLTGVRYSDEQLTAIGRFLESLQPPKNPHKPNSFTKKGKAIFDREGCARCHTGSPRLSPAPGFRPPPEDIARFDVVAESAGTDPRLALETRLGTGYYRIPELTGLWYRGPFGHSGNVEALEHWFSGMRLRDDFFAAGFGGLGGAQGAVRGHEYGLKLSDQEMAALLGYLRTL